MEFFRRFGHLIMFLGIALITTGGLIMTRYNPEGVLTMPKIIIGIGIAVYLVGRVGIFNKNR